MKDFEYDPMNHSENFQNSENNRNSFENQTREAKKSRRNSGKSVRAAAAFCAACVILSGATGFGGSLLANSLNTASAVTAVEEADEARETPHGSLTVKPVAATQTTLDIATSTSGEDMTYAEVAACVKDSVVEINTEYTVRNAWYQATSGGAGSGVIFSEDGYILTNAHVILDSNMQNPADTVTVRLTDGTEYPAEIRAYDTDEDIAVLKIEAEGLHAARAGDSDKLVVGEELVIVGNPLGELGGSVSNGIVSATEREIQVGGVKMHLIQTNAAVNPGNSGGGMFNLRGELVGIVNAKSSGTGIEGIGFAIPVNEAISVADELMTKGYVSGKPMIGVSLEDVSASNSYGMFFSGMETESQILVRALTDGMNDDVLEVGDRIIAVNGEEVSSSTDVKAAVSAASVGDTLTFTLYRDNKLMEVEVKVYERTPEAMSALNEMTEEEAQPEEAVEEAPKSEKKSGGRHGSAPEDEMPEEIPNGESGEEDGMFRIPESLADIFGGR